MKIKVCGMRDSVNLAGVLGLSPDMVGFIFYPPSPRFVKEGDLWQDGGSLVLSGELNQVSSGQTASQKVGVFVNASEEEVLAETATHRLDYVQLHGDESPGFCASIQGFVPVIKAFRVGSEFDFSVTDAYQEACDLFLFDAKGLRFGGNGTKFDWERLADYNGPTPFLLSGGIGPGDVEAIASLAHPFLEGVDVNSGFELKPGMKDVQVLRSFVNDIRGMDENMSAI